MKKLLSLVIIVLVTAPLLHAQQAWVVDDTFGPGVDFLDFQTAVDNVADGDTILAREGFYAGFSVDAKGLTIVSDDTGIVSIDGGISVSNLPIGSEVRLVGLTVLNTAGGHGILGTNNIGSFILDHCSMTGGHGLEFAGVLVQACDSVSILSCTLSGGVSGNSLLTVPLNGGSGLEAIDSSVFILQSFIEGEQGSTGTSNIAFIGDGGVGGTGVLQRGGFLGFQDTSIVAGNGGNGVGSIVAGCGDGGQGGVGLRLELSLVSGAPLAELNSTSPAAGFGGSPGIMCTPGQHGADFDILAGSYNSSTTTGADLQVTTLFQDGQFGFVSVLGTAGDVVQIAVSSSSSPIWDSLALAPAIPQNPTLYTLGVIPAWGILNRAVSLRLTGGNLIQHFVIQVQSGPSGGSMIPGSAAILTIVDERY